LDKIVRIVRPRNSHALDALTCIASWERIGAILNKTAEDYAPLADKGERNALQDVCGTIPNIVAALYKSIIVTKGGVHNTPAQLCEVANTDLEILQKNADLVIKAAGLYGKKTVDDPDNKIIAFKTAGGYETPIRHPAQDEAEQLKAFIGRLRVYLELHDDGPSGRAERPKPHKTGMPGRRPN
ncbi:MAG: hypothetical protein WCY57_09505, partial [Micavibrio sp.]